MSDHYDVLPIPVHLGGIVDKKTNVVKPLVGIYFPAELLKKMKWTKESRLTLAVEKDGLRIFRDESREPFIYDVNELVYELDEDEN